MKALGKRSEDIEQWEVRFQQQLVHSESTQAELNNIKRTLSAKEDLLLEMAATNRRLEIDVTSMKVQPIKRWKIIANVVIIPAM